MKLDLVFGENGIGELYKLLWDELDSDKVALVKPYTYQTIYLLKNEGR